MGAGIHRAENSVLRPRSPVAFEGEGSRRIPIAQRRRKANPANARSVGIYAPRALAASTTRPDTADGDFHRNEARGRYSLICHRGYDVDATTSIAFVTTTRAARRAFPTPLPRSRVADARSGVVNQALCSVRRHGAGLLRGDFAIRGRSGLAAARKPDKKDLRKIERPARIFRRGHAQSIALEPILVDR
jgi:hypothetical protein